MTDEEMNRIWCEWKRMHFRSKTLLAQLETIDEWSALGGTIMRELDELNTQMAQLEDNNEDWLTEMVINEFT
jgi:hypothetical protein